MAEVPLIWTSKGNVPLDSLTYATAWEVTADYIKFTETHTDAAGEVVKESAHVFDKLGVCATGAVASF